jgi:hypothetical protein
MTQILGIEMAALVIAAVGNSLADSLYFGGRLSPVAHALWVSLSTAGTCVPLLAWVVPIFVGPGAPATALVAVFGLALLGLLYRQLRTVPIVRRAGFRPHPAVEEAPPPASG